MTVVGSSGYVCLRGRVCAGEAQAAISGASCDYEAMEAYVRRVVSDAMRWVPSEFRAGDVMLFHGTALS